jgi:NAD+ synthetase
MKIRIQQLNPTIGDIDGNTQKIQSALKKAENKKVKLLILPELCTCGYSPMDLLEYSDFLDDVGRANQRIIKETKLTALIFGTLTPNQDKHGRPCFNAALMAQEGKIIGEIHKTLLPNYDVYDEARYFEPNKSFHCVEWQERKLGITIYEDIWGNTQSPQGGRYVANPVRELVDLGAEAIINISASHFTISKSESRLKMLQEYARNSHRPVFYANQVGANTSLVSDGDSMVVNSKGKVIARAPLFEESFVDVEWEETNEVKAINPTPPAKLPSRNERNFQALKRGLKDYIKKTGITADVILGLSGGIDSALAACIAAEAIGPEHVMGAAMPSEFSSENSAEDAELLAENLGIGFQKIPIKSIYHTYLDALVPIFGDTEFGTAEENLQARIRGVLLMAIANKFNLFLLNSGNKSELAMGYCTLYGDTNGALAIISDLYKTEVYELARWLNKSYYNKEIIPQEILDKPPSAELRPGQKDSDHLPEYGLLDSVLKLYLEEQQSIKDIVACGFDKDLVEQIIQMADQNEYKRYQSPPGIKIQNKSFGTGRRRPVVQAWKADEKNVEF